MVERAEYTNNSSSFKAKSKIELTQYQKTKQKKEAAERNHIEGKFGQAKKGYNLNKTRAKLKETSG